MISMTFFTAIYTTWGSKQVIDIASHYSGGEFKVDNISGAIAENLTLKKLSFKNESSEIKLEQAVFNWEWNRIFSGEISISRFELEKLAVELEEQVQKPVSDESKFTDLAGIMNIDLGLLLSLKLRQFSITNSYIKYGAQKYSIDAAQLGSSLEDSVVQIDIENANAQVQQQPLNLKAKLKFDTSGEVPALNGDFAWSTKIETDKFSGKGVIRGDFSKLVLNHKLTKPWQIESDVIFGIDQEVKPYYSVKTKWKQVEYPVNNPEIVAGESIIKLGGNNLGLEFSVNSSINYQQTPFRINTSGKFDWKTLELKKLDIVSDAKFTSSISGELDISKNIDWHLKVASTLYNVDQFIPELQQQQLHPKVNIVGSFNNLTAKAQSSIDITIADIFASELQSNIEIVYAGNNINAQTQILTPYKIQSDVLLDIEKSSFDIKLNWQQLFWPLKQLRDYAYDFEGELNKQHVAAGEVFISDNGEIKLKGTVDNYQIAAQFGAGLEALNADISLFGKGSRKWFEISDSSVNTSIGNVQAKGNVSWENEIQWDTNITAANVDLETMGLTQSDIGLKINAIGSYSDKNTNLIAKISDVKGSLGQDQLSGFGHIALNQVPTKADVNAKIELNLGETLAKLNIAASQAGDNIVVDGDYNFNIASMKQLIPNSKGKASVFGKIFTDEQGYHAAGKSLLTEFKVTDFRCEKGDAQYKISASNVDDVINSMQSQIRGDFTNLSFAETKFQQAKVIAKGRAKDHSLILTVQGDYNGNLVVKGGLDQEQNWKGKLADLEIMNDTIGKWSSAVTDIQFNNNALNINSLCLNGSRKSNKNYEITSEKLCFNGTISEPVTEIAIGINKIDLLRFKHILPPDIDIKGVIGGDIDVSVSDLDILNANIRGNIKSENGVLKLTLIDKKKVDLPYEMLIDGNLNKRHGTFKASIKVNDNLDSSAVAQFKLPDDGADMGRTIIDSNIKLQLNNFEWVDEIWPEFESVKAVLMANASANGTLGDLSYSGKANISNGEVAILPAGIKLKDINAEVDFSSDIIDFKGYASSGDGKISISGNAEKQKIYPVSIDIIGEKFRVVDSYEAKVDISPLLAITLKENQANLNGGVNIDTARIRIGDLPDTAVSISDDVNIIEPGSKESSAPYETQADIKLNLGENFSFKGFGLTTKLKGALNIKQKKGLREGFGELELIDGKFKKLGIKLDVEKGQLIFVGPLENPAVNIKAARKLERAKKDEKVSVIIEGTLKKPRLVFPEESTYGQTNTMSNLLTGKSVGENGGDENQKSQALYSVGLSAGGRFKDQLQEGFGLDSLEVTAAGWMLGKYLTPDLYVSYTTKWMQSETQLKLRYNLNRLFTLEANSGSQQGADIFYTLEKE